MKAGVLSQRSESTCEHLSSIETNETEMTSFSRTTNMNSSMGMNVNYSIGSLQSNHSIDSFLTTKQRAISACTVINAGAIDTNQTLLWNIRTSNLVDRPGRRHKVDI